MEKVKEIYIDEIGLIFETVEGKKYTYKYYHNVSGAIEEIYLEEIK